MRITDETRIDRYYTALMKRDEGYLGLFFAAVKTTAIFCISTCRARKPKKENVIFFEHFSEALENGYRPCKICCPTENAHMAPAEVERAIQLVRDNPKTKIKDQKLRDEGLSPDNIRRWFKTHYGITFHAFQRMYRINVAYEELKQGSYSSEMAYSSGFESLSGFNYTFKKLLGKSPKKIESHKIILVNRFTTPLGPMIVCASSKGICLLEFSNRPMLETEFGDIQMRMNATILIGENNHIAQLRTELNEYFSGLRKTFDISLHLIGTVFQKEVWEALKKISYGTTLSYKQLAQKMNRDQSVRAVASANGFNKIAIVIPCHRVIGSDGSLKGYGGGLERKKWLIRHEAYNAINHEDMSNQLK